MRCNSVLYDIDISPMKKILALSVIVLLFLGTNSNAQLLNNSPYDKVGMAMQIINYAYVDTVKMDKLAEVAIVAMLKDLDPHSSYISKEDLEEANQPLEGSFEGIGIQFQILNDTIVVISPISGGPSERLGIQAGDKIISIEGKSAVNIKIKNEDVIKQLRGKKGTTVTVSILKVGTQKMLDYTITRDKIPLYSVDASYMVTPEIGYIKCSRFAATTMDEFRSALSKLNEKGMKSLILDLIDNGGGLLNVAIDMADEFLGDKKLIVFTQGVYAPKQISQATSKGSFEKGKLVVLIDEGSASASEIVSGAIQDWDRGLIIGRRSFGKGLVQKPFQLSDGSQIRLTVAHYYTPVGRCIQKPYENGADEYYKDLYNRKLKGELFSADSIHFPDSLKYFTPNNRTVYGGGGIMPDIFVPADTSKNSEYLYKLASKGLFNRFTLEYVDRERSKLMAAYPNGDEFIKNFKTEKSFMDAFTAFAEKDSVVKDMKGFETSKDIIQMQLKARIAQDLFGNDAMFRIYNEMNPPYLKAIEAIKGDTFSKMKIAGK